VLAQGLERVLRIPRHSWGDRRAVVGVQCNRFQRRAVRRAFRNGGSIAGTDRCQRAKLPYR
jgi:hypothetical protein